MAVRKIKKMAKGGNPCDPGYYWGPNGDCIPQAKKPGLLAGNSAKLGVGILSGLGAGMAAVARATSQKVADKKALKKQVDETAKKLTSNVMKKGGSTRNAKLAAMTPPKNKITRGDIITAAKRKAKKK
jgi:hypothetical protein